jgi:elongation factor G
MNIEIEVPEDFQGTVVGDVIRRRGIMSSNDIIEGISVIKAEVPLAETFGYATDLRSLTQGQGTFTMELAAYRQTPSNIQVEIIEAKKKQQLVGAK